MPGFDGTGPNGKGPMTGGCRGYCALVLNEPGQALKVKSGFYGRGGGRCRGGKGYRNNFYATGKPGWLSAQE